MESPLGLALTGLCVVDAQLHRNRQHAHHKGEHESRVDVESEIAKDHLASDERQDDSNAVLQVLEHVLQSGEHKE
mgnify:CR=1 FL=1